MNDVQQIQHLDNPKSFNCTICTYTTERKSSYDKHLLTSKHINANISLTQANRSIFKCQTCLQTFKHAPSLSRHKRNCFKDEGKTVEPITHSLNTITDNFLELKQFMVEIVRSNSELQKQCFDMQKQVLDVCQKIHPTTQNNIAQQNNNNTFNMQVFLNEYCKDAMNLTEFVDSIQLSLADLELVGEKGFVDGVSRIVVNYLRKTEVHLRPIHCSDAKREVMYIKENDKWEKDGPNNDNMRKFVQYIEGKNIRLLSTYLNENPTCMESDSPLNDHYLRLTGQATCATTEHFDKVIRRIAKEVLIEK